MEWIDVKEKLPDPMLLVLCYDTQQVYIAFRPQENEYNEHWAICKDGCCSCNGCTGAVTHWMPLPTGPDDLLSKPTELNEKCHLDEKLENAVKQIAHGHRKIIDDWCKAYLAQMYEEGHEIKPGCFTLFEQELNFREGNVGRKYWFEPRPLTDLLPKITELIDELKEIDPIIPPKLPRGKAIQLGKLKAKINRISGISEELMGPVINEPYFERDYP